MREREGEGEERERTRERDLVGRENGRQIWVERERERDGEWRGKR